MEHLASDSKRPKNWRFEVYVINDIRQRTCIMFILFKTLNILFHISFLKGGKVYITCRSSKSGADAVEKISAATGKTVIPLILDLASLQSVRNLTESFKQCKLQALWRLMVKRNIFHKSIFSACC